MKTECCLEFKLLNPGMDTVIGTIPRESYAELFKRYSPNIYMCIMNFIRYNNISVHKDEIDDIFQEVALKIVRYRYLDKFDDSKSSLSTWVKTITRTVTIDYYRKNVQNMNTETLEDYEIPSEEQEGTGEFTLPQGVLTGRQEEVLTLSLRDGWETKDIARKLNVTQETVRSTKFQALERLRKHYGISQEAAEHKERAS